MNRILLTFFITILAFTAQNQNKLLTIDDAVIGYWRQLYPQNLNNLQWKGDSKYFTFQDYNYLYQQAENSDDTIQLLSLNELNKIITCSKIDSLTSIPYLIWENADEFHFYSKNTWCAISFQNKKVIASIRLPENAENKNLWYNQKKIAFTVANNLSVIDTQNIEINITTDIDKNIVNGQTVSRNEFGIKDGIFWSPKGNYIAFYRKDETKVGNYPLVDITAREAELKQIKYPMAGMASEHISLGVYNLNTKKTVFIEGNDTISEKYLTNISWGLNEQFIYIQVLNRAQNQMKLNKYKVYDGSLTNTLFEETHKKYVEPHAPLLFINEDDDFIYQTRTYGYNHTYLYNQHGKLLKQITAGNWELNEIIDFKDGYLYYTSGEESAIEKHFYKISLKSGKKTKLTSTSGVHEVLFNSKTTHFIDSYSNTTTPRKINIYNSNGGKIKEVLQAPNPLISYNMPNMEIGSLKADDGSTDLYYRLIKPIDFDSTKKYPVIVYVYGGPHVQLVENSWLGGAGLWPFYMAQKGYIMFTLDNRGSANRGLDFENVVHRQLGVIEMKDQMQGIDFLTKQNYVDINKIGVHGWSFGGFMTTSLMVNYPETIKVGVAGGPVIDWKYYEVMYGERYMDTPEENPDGYAFTSLISRSKNLKGKLLLIHGGVDPVVVMQHSQLFIQECIKNRLPIDYFIYPRAEHNVSGYDRIHLMHKVTDYFDTYLKQNN